MDSEILDQLTNLERHVDSEVTKSKRGRKKKIDPKINKVEENDVREVSFFTRRGTLGNFSSFVNF